MECSNGVPCSFSARNFKSFGILPILSEVISWFVEAQAALAWLKSEPANSSSFTIFSHLISYPNFAYHEAKDDTPHRSNELLVYLPQHKIDILSWIYRNSPPLESRPSREVGAETAGTRI